MKVLVVDDERTIANYVATGLNHFGYRALPLYSPEDAIEHARVLEFDAALVGFVMPGMLGTEIAVRIKTLSPETKIVITVEEVPPEVAESLRRRGFDFDYLPAPFEWNDLVALLHPNGFLMDFAHTGEAPQIAQIEFLV